MKRSPIARAQRRSQADPGLGRLGDLVRDVVGAAAAVEVHEEWIKSGVCRLLCTTNATTRSFVGKRLDPDIARRNELVARRWLPAVGLGDSGPPLLAAAAERDASSVWHLYEDLGAGGLGAAPADGHGLALAVAAIARIHTRFAGHALLPEVRLWGGDLGISFYLSSVGDAIASLESLHERRHRLGVERSSLCRRLHARLGDLLEQHPRRAEGFTRSGGPETLLHGDLWPANVLVVSRGSRAWARLIDWDHAAVGPVSYDLSTFLSRLTVRDRAPALRLYEEEVGRAGWHLPSAADMNLMFETAELARIANRVIWPALAAWEHDADWAFDALEEVERWFEQLTPILPTHEACSRS